MLLAASKYRHPHAASKAGRDREEATAPCSSWSRSRGTKRWKWKVKSARSLLNRWINQSLNQSSMLLLLQFFLLLLLLALSRPFFFASRKDSDFALTDDSFFLLFAPSADLLCSSQLSAIDSRLNWLSDRLIQRINKDEHFSLFIFNIPPFALIVYWFWVEISSFLLTGDNSLCLNVVSLPFSHVPSGLHVSFCGVNSRLVISHCLLAPLAQVLDIHLPFEPTFRLFVFCQLYLIMILSVNSLLHGSCSRIGILHCLHAAFHSSLHDDR